MSETITNVVVGTGNVYIADEATVLPTITGTLGSAITWGTGWSTPGFLVKDIELKFGEDLNDFTPRGYVTPVKAAIKKKDASGKFTLAEADIAALELALSNAVLASNVLSDGGSATDVVYKAIAIETPLCVYHFKRVHIKSDFSVKLNDTDFVEIPIEFNAYARAAETAGQQVYQIHQRTSGS